MASSGDPPIAGLDFNEMSKEQRHELICTACGMKDPMCSLVWVVGKQKTGLPNVECRACLAAMRGGPGKIMIHNLPEVKGVATCKPGGISSIAEAERAKKIARARFDEKENEKRDRKRKADLHEKVQQAKRAAAARQPSLAESASVPSATAAVSSKRELDEIWAKCCYDQRMPFAIFDSDPFKEAVKATSQLLLPRGKNGPPNRKAIASGGAAAEVRRDEGALEMERRVLVRTPLVEISRDLDGRPLEPRRDKSDPSAEVRL
jgi:hypothetical protein